MRTAMGGANWGREFRSSWRSSQLRERETVALRTERAAGAAPTHRAPTRHPPGHAAARHGRRGERAGRRDQNFARMPTPKVSPDDWLLMWSYI